MIRCLTVATLAASLLAALYVGLWMAARRPRLVTIAERDRGLRSALDSYDPEGLFV